VKPPSFKVPETPFTEQRYLARARQFRRATIGIGR